AAVHRMMVVLLPVVIFLLIWPLPGGIQGYLSVGDWVLVDVLFLRRLWDVIILHLIALFVAAMVCHGELARTRPATPHLTEFYIWMSLGGVLGGVFNALLAPLLFDRVVEYPLVIAGACLLLPRLTVPSSPRWFRWADAGLAAALGVFGLIVGSYLLARTYLTTR